jgi:hypothetical protein
MCPFCFCITNFKTNFGHARLLTFSDCADEDARADFDANFYAWSCADEHDDETLGNSAFDTPCDEECK